MREGTKTIPTFPKIQKLRLMFSNILYARSVNFGICRFFGFVGVVKVAAIVLIF